MKHTLLFINIFSYLWIYSTEAVNLEPEDNGTLKSRTERSADFNYKQRLTPDPDHLLTTANSERVFYSHSPYSVFHTQINVQSQDSEYNAGETKTKGRHNLIINPLNEHLLNAPREVQINILRQRANNGPSRFLRTLIPDNEADNAVSASSDQRSYQDWIESKTQTQQKPNDEGDEIESKAETSLHEDANIQGINIARSNVGVIPDPHLSDLPRTVDSNIQGVNIIESNILGFIPSLNSLIQYNSLPSSSEKHEDAAGEKDTVDEEITETTEETVTENQVELQDNDVESVGYNYPKPEIEFYYK